MPARGAPVGGAAQRVQRVCVQQVARLVGGLVQQQLLQAERRLLVHLRGGEGGGGAGGEGGRARPWGEGGGRACWCMWGAFF